MAEQEGKEELWMEKQSRYTTAEYRSKKGI
jgi:hypothetical protein